MGVVAIDFGPNPLDRLAALGLKLFTLRGVRQFNDETSFEPPCLVLAAIDNGTRLRLGAFSMINGGRVGNLVMGRYCSIAPDVSIGAHEHPVDWLGTSGALYQPHLHDWARFAGAGDLAALQAKKLPFAGACPVTTIGNDVWLGQGVFLKAGVRIGDGAIIGARSVVLEDVPPYAIAVGTPARVKRYRFPEPVIARLLALRWWRFSVYDLYGVPFDRIEAALDRIEAMAAAGALAEYRPAPITAECLKSALSGSGKPN